MRQDDWSFNQKSVNPVTATTGAFAAFNTMGLAGLSITIRPDSGTVNGQFKIQVTDFGEDQNHLPGSSDWADYPSAVAPASSGAVSAAQNIQIWALESKWARLVFTDNSSSSPVVSIAITGRARS